MQFVLPRLVRIIKPVKHEAISQLAATVVESVTFPKPTWFHIALTFPTPQEDVLTAPFVYHPFLNIKMLSLNTVSGHIFPKGVPFEMGLHLVHRISKIGIDREVVAAAVN